jgi:hypothetical protein
MANFGLHLSKDGKPGGKPSCGINGHTSGGFDDFHNDKNHCLKCHKSKNYAFMLKKKGL